MDVGFVRTNIALMVLSAVAVMVRFWSRFVERKGRFWWDDWTCLLAAVSIFLALSPPDSFQPHPNIDFFSP